MDKLAVGDLWSLEQYHKRRPEFRARVMAHKQRRQLLIGPSVRLSFEDRLTMQYQVQEMLRIERIFEAEAIEEELATYNPLVPDGRNLKATMMIEVPDVEERHRALARLAGIEDKIYWSLDGFENVYAIADEDMERTTPDKTSAVHFLRFEFSEDACRAFKDGAGLRFGCDHDAYRHEALIGDELRSALLADLS